MGGVTNKRQGVRISHFLLRFGLYTFWDDAILVVNKTSFWKTRFEWYRSVGTFFGQSTRWAVSYLNVCACVERD